MVLGVLNRLFFSVLISCALLLCISFSLSSNNKKADNLVGRWKVTEESKELRIQTYRSSIDADAKVKVLADGNRCPCFIVHNFAGFGKDSKLKVYGYRGNLLIDSVQVFNKQLSVLTAVGKIGDKSASISWNYTMRVKSKEIHFKATYVEEK